jgi:hypothetical protein
MLLPTTLFLVTATGFLALELRRQDEKLRYKKLLKTIAAQQANYRKYLSVFGLTKKGD